MKIITLMENTSGSEEFLFEHGLSLYIETEKHKLLMDTGSSDGFLKNAEKLGIDPVSYTHLTLPTNSLV